MKMAAEMAVGGLRRAITFLWLAVMRGERGAGPSLSSSHQPAVNPAERD